jgi:hypothetical protein
VSIKNTFHKSYKRMWAENEYGRYGDYEDVKEPKHKYHNKS